MPKPKLSPGDKVILDNGRECIISFSQNVSRPKTSKWMGVEHPHWSLYEEIPLSRVIMHKNKKDFIWRAVSFPKK